MTFFCRLLVQAVVVAIAASAGSSCVDAIRDLIGAPDSPAPLGGDAPTDLPTPELPELPDSDAGQPCTEAADCRSLDDCCTRGFCYQGTCQLTWLPDCCTQQGSCAVSAPFYSAYCDTPCGEGSCVKSLVLPESCEAEPAYRFDPSAASLTDLIVTDPAPDDTVSWQLSTRRGLEGRRSLYAGDVRCPTYHTGPLDAACEPTPSAIASPVELAFSTQPFTLAADRPSVLRVWLWLDLEDTQRAGGLTNAFDGLEIGVRRTAASYTRTVWSTREAPVEQGAWVPVIVDLSQDAGVEVTLWFIFSTLDGLDNHHEGVYVGSIEVLTPCVGDRTCPLDSVCVRGLRVPVAGTGDDLCVQSSDPPGEPCQPCESVDECVTVDACDTAACAQGRCLTVRELTPECCTPDERWPEPPSFESVQGEGWIYDPPISESTSGQWHRSQQRAFDGAWSLRFGVPGEVVTALPGQSGEQLVWSPPFTVPDDQPVLRFALWLATEWDAAPSASNPLGLDRLSLRVGLPGASTPPAEIWGSELLGGTTQGAWVAVEVSLALFAGLEVTLGVHFSTADEAVNDSEGAYLDSVSVVRRCPACDPDDPGCDEGRLR